MSKRKDECLFCTSRNCRERVVSIDKIYDEVSCINHVLELHQHSDTNSKCKMRHFISSTGKMRRGEELPEGSIQLEKQQQELKKAEV